MRNKVDGIAIDGNGGESTIVQTLVADSGANGLRFFGNMTVDAYNVTVANSGAYGLAADKRATRAIASVNLYNSIVALSAVKDVSVANGALVNGHRTLANADGEGFITYRPDQAARIFVDAYNETVKDRDYNLKNSANLRERSLAINAGDTSLDIS